MDAAAVSDQVATHPFWWHSIDLGNGITTPGHKPASVLADELSALRLPDLAGKSVLDIGAWDGYFSFAAERLGAERVVALDYFTWATDPIAFTDEGRSFSNPAQASSHVWDPVDLPGKRGFDLAREALGSRVESVFGELFAMDPASLGEFDVVLFLGVLYHTPHPLAMLERVASLTGELMVLETESFVLPGYETGSFGEFFEGDELGGDPTNWWSFTEPALEGMCRAGGFATVEFLAPYHRYDPTPAGLVRHRALAHVRKAMRG